MPAEPEWRKVETAKEAVLRKEAIAFALSLHGAKWGPKHDHALSCYLEKNG